MRTNRLSVLFFRTYRLLSSNSLIHTIKVRLMKTALDYLKLNIKHYRTLRKISQQELAEKSGFSTSFIADVELGRRLPSLKSLVKISDALSVETYLLLVNPETNENESVKLFSEDLLEKITEYMVDLKSRY